MEVIKKIQSKTCYFVIQTSFENEFVVQESSCGTSGHLMRKPLENVDTYSDYNKFLIYPDPSSKGNYRLVVVGWPDLQVVLESNRARIVNFENSDKQRFKFKIAASPKIEKNKSNEWNYLVGVGENLNFDFASNKYVYPSKSTGDQTKLKFIPVDIVEPDATKIKTLVNFPAKELAPPQNYIKTKGNEWGNKVSSIEAIPAALITDDDYLSKVAQIADSPYYYLKHEILWSSKQLRVVTLTKNNKSEYVDNYISAFKSSDYKSVEKTIGHTFDASVEISANVNAGEVEVGASAKLAYQYQDQTKKISTSSNSSEENISESIKQVYRQLDEDEGDIFIVHWIQVDRYTLTNSNGVLKGTWDYTNSNLPIPQEVKR